MIADLALEAAQAHAAAMEGWLAMKRRKREVIAELRMTHPALLARLRLDANIAAHRAALRRADAQEVAAWDAWCDARDGRRSHKRRAHKLWLRRHTKTKRLYRALERMGVHPDTGLPYVPSTDSDAPPLPPR